MQIRHTNREIYFRELEATSAAFYVDYVSSFKELNANCRILEVGCGEGGNLVPFAKMGCKVTGIDIAACRIEEARDYFAQVGGNAEFVCCDFTKYPLPQEEKDKYDVVLMHDVIEHIDIKEVFLMHLKGFLKTTGILFVGFPAWQMPFGGHQQICKSKICSHLPFVHLLPAPLYKSFLSVCGESVEMQSELLSIKHCATSIELFERIVKRCGYTVADKKFWFINPHYQQKFNLTPRLLYRWMWKVRFVRNFFTTSCWYIIRLSAQESSAS